MMNAAKTLVRPVAGLPVGDLSGRIVGAQIRLSSGAKVWGLLSNLDVNDPAANEQLMAVAIEKSGKWFHLARYHDHSYKRLGPDALALFLGLPKEGIFPIAYDIRPFSNGAAGSLVGSINVDPKIRLGRAEIMALATRRRK